MTTEIVKEGGKTIIKTVDRIDASNAYEFENDIQSALQETGVNLEMDCAELTYIASSGLRVIQKTMRAVMKLKGQFKLVNVNPSVFKVLQLTGFTKFITVEQKP
jgi:stage II sporulation protein AA (anti-sigma F factor antagonist)